MLPTPPAFTEFGEFLQSVGRFRNGGDVGTPILFRQLVVFARICQIAANIIDDFRFWMNPDLPRIQRRRATIFVIEFELFSGEHFPRFRIFWVRFNDPPAQLDNRRVVRPLLRRFQLLPQYGQALVCGVKKAWGEDQGSWN